MAENQDRAVPLLTLETVLNAVIGVRNWRKFGSSLLGRGIVHIDEDGESYTNLDMIESEHISDDTRIKAVILSFLNGGWFEKKPTWRAVVWSLFKADEIVLADQIRSYTEPVQDATLTVDNVIKVLETVATDKTMKVLETCGISKSIMEAKGKCFLEDKKKIEVCVDLYLSCYQDEPTWESVTFALYECDEMAAAKEARNFQNNIDTNLTTDKVVEAMKEVTSNRIRKIWKSVLTYKGLSDHNLYINNIYAKYTREEDRMHTLASVYVYSRPESSCLHLLNILYSEGELKATKKLMSFLEQNDATLTIGNIAIVMEMVTVNKRKQLWLKLLGQRAKSDIDKIYESYTGEDDRIHHCSNMYVSCCPTSSWEHLTSLLYEEDERTAMDLASQYLQPKDLTITTERVKHFFENVEDQESSDSSDDSEDGWETDTHSSRDSNIGVNLGLPPSIIKDIKKNYWSSNQRRDAYIDEYTHNHPCPSWKKVADVLRDHHSLGEQADEVEKIYVQVTKITQLNFDAAMMNGSLRIRNGNVFFLGPGGSGKTHTLAILLKEDPPSIRESTPCAKKPIRAIAYYKIGVEGTRFIRISDDQFSDMLSSTAKYLQSTVSKSSKQVASKHVHELSDSDGVQINLEPPAPKRMRLTTRSSSEEQKESQPSQHKGLKAELLHRMQAVHKSSQHLNERNLINMRDSGGQPMFHEVLPLFVQNTTFGVLTVKLNESLDDYPLVEYFSNGEPVGDPLKSPFTHLQIFNHCMRVLQSTCDHNACPKIVFIGTHKDLEHQCTKEGRDKKNEKLRNIIPPSMKDSIIYCGESQNDLLFAINAKEPGQNEYQIIDDVRELMIQELQKLPWKSIPLQYFSLEMMFLRLAKYQNKTILSKEDCFKEAAAYHFTKQSFDAALTYLTSLKLIFYYADVLPGIIFVDAQSLLDKITELVEFSLTNLTSKKPIVGSIEEFKAYGIITLEILARFKSHYVPDVFMEKQLILLFKYLRLIAEIGKGKYLMPCLLKLEGIPLPLPYSNSLVISALLFYFGPDGPKLGIYCFLIACLISEAKWELITENNCPVQASRNRIQFALPGENPGCITITDSFSTFFHVSIEFPEDVSSSDALQICENVCPIIRETIFVGIRKASQKLNYKTWTPKIAFPCLKHRDTDLHPATISDSGKHLICTSYRATACCDVTDHHKLWLGRDAEGSPMNEINQQKLLDRVLDCDNSGVSKDLGQIADSMHEWEGSVAEHLGLRTVDIATIKTEYPAKLNLQVRAALEKWKQYQGSNATYRNLIVAFEQANHKDFAATVQMIATQ